MTWYDFKQGLKNLIIYGPTIWKTREWDQVFLYELTAFKLKQMELHHRKHRLIEDWSKVASQLLIARIALERVIRDEYPGFKEFCGLTKNQRENFDILKFKKDDEMTQADLELFAHYFVKKSRGWWD